MKKIISIVLGLSLLYVFTGQALAVKPSKNLASAQTVEWNLSADVMPALPYGTIDIPGSDTASKLIVNQPNGNVEVALTGVMKGLLPATSYTVYLSNGYEPYVETGWNVTGSYVIDLEYNGGHYTEHLTLNQSGGNITGTLALAGNNSPWTIDSGAVVGDQLSFHAYYNSSPSLKANFTATIETDGSLSNGTWADVTPGTRSGTWTSTSGNATKTFTGDTGWPGLFTTTIQAFTFVTDEFGEGSWHVNVKESDYSIPGIASMSVWINQTDLNKTMLISDVFEITFE